MFNFILFLMIKIQLLSFDSLSFSIGVNQRRYNIPGDLQIAITLNWNWKRVTGVTKEGPPEKRGIN